MHAQFEGRSVGPCWSVGSVLRYLSLGFLNYPLPLYSTIPINQAYLGLIKDLSGGSVGGGSWGTP